MKKGQARHPSWWQAFGYAAVFMPFLFLLASLWIAPEFNRQEVPDWRPVVALAETARAKGELLEATDLYSRVSRIAAWNEDWGGLLAAACGMKKLDSAAGSYLNTHPILVRAMMVAELKQSRAGIAAVARAFAAIGEDKAASMVLARIRKGWPEETLESDNSDTEDCWRSRESVTSDGGHDK